MPTKSELLDELSKKLTTPLHKKILAAFQSGQDTSAIIKELIATIQAKCDEIKKS